ncbi:hypothetical protein PsorP6_016633 [Peronosclerospora sorghi]|uniref:Uncharacterized protein n=1 Tax=Peronosclerospora sorghi TaxID=230839 RepID=A0ACC0VMR4_9STRA|nr:hypothetical protein PsorP6_016633 [Peronosclerospora sorghi]
MVKIVHRSPRLNTLGDTGVYLAMQIEKMFQLMNVDKFDARSWEKWRHVVSMEIQTVLTCSEGVEGQDTFPFLYSQVLVQTCVSEVDDLRAFLQTQVQARRLCAPKATSNAVVPLRKLRPLQVDAKDEDRFVDARDLLADALFKVHPTTKPVVDFVVASVTTDLCAYVLTHLVTPGDDHLVARCVARGLGCNVSHETRCVVPAARDGAHVSGIPRDGSRSARRRHEARGSPSRVGTAIALIAVVASFHHAGGGGDCARTDVIGFNHPRLVSFWSVFCHAALLLDTGSNGEADLLEFMWFEICRPDLRKFSFCSNCPADIVNGKISRELQARALEIPSIRRDVRKVFFCVPLLMRVCSDREEIEVKTEW